MRTTARWAVLAAAVCLAAIAVSVAATPAQSAPTSSMVGCKVVGKKKTGKSFLFRTTLAVVRGRVSFCWNGNRVLRAQPSCEVLFYDRNTVENHGCDASGWYYQWGGNPTGGYEAQLSFKFGNCVLKAGCFGDSTYNMHIRVHADGSWN